MKQYGQVFKLNPDVADVSEKYATVYNNIALLVLGGLEKGGTGCACPENTFIRALITDLVLYKNETLVIDMEAGVEHLGRATVQGVDTLILVLEPSSRSISVGHRIIQMATEIHLKSFKIVINKVKDPSDIEFVHQSFPDLEILGAIPFSEEIQNNERNKVAVLDNAPLPIVQAYTHIVENLVKDQKSNN